VSKTYTPTLYNAAEYLFKSTPSSRVLPSFKPSKRLNNVLKPVPTVSALWRVVAVIVANAAVAYSYDNPTVLDTAANFSRPVEISSELDAVAAPNAVITSA